MSCYVMGIDIGSTTSKGVVLKDGSEIVSTYLIHAGTGTKGPATVKEELLKSSGLKEDDIAYTVVTGYGRKTYVEADAQLSELSCHAKGAHYLFPEARTVIDIGGQDAKVMKLDGEGRMTAFLMNDKCAAGTGRFLEVMAAILQLDVSQLEEEAAKAGEALKISSTCTVFAESEVISQLSNGAEIPALVKGICKSVASRVGALAKRIGIEEKVCMSGGVANNGGVRDALAEELGKEIGYSPLAQLTGALGAAIYAYERATKERKDG
ncbi:MAG: 2-hydroxyglutaryl-CoA dehydratase [Erysipelotrichaceae bacterium]|nr:2-hydroxyglutaryl-CoA dehydratase [Erysipelotrichaceae bacterium]